LSQEDVPVVPLQIPQKLAQRGGIEKAQLQPSRIRGQPEDEEADLLVRLEFRLFSPAPVSDPDQLVADGFSAILLRNLSIVVGRTTEN